MSSGPTGLAGVLMLVAAAMSLAVATAVLLRGSRGRLQWSLGLGLAAFAVESLTGFMLAVVTESPAERLLWLRIHSASGLLVPIPWALFAVTLAYSRADAWPRGWRIGLGAGSVVAAAFAAAVTGLPAFEISEIPGPFYAARLEPVALYAVVVQLLWTVAILAAFEASLRGSHGVDRWRVKYLVLGAGGVFLVRFFFLSQLLLFHVVFAVYLMTIAATLAMGSLVIAGSLARDRLAGLELSVSRGVVYRSIAVGILGLYLFVVGVLGWLLTYLQISNEIFWTSVVVFVSALGLAAVLLSESVRWRLKRFIGLNFYRSKYDYREQWSSFTTRLGSLLAVEEIAAQALAAVCEAIGTTRGAIYVLDERDGTYHPATAVEAGAPLPAIAASAALVARLAAERKPVGLQGAEASDLGAVLARTFPEGSFAVPLLWRGSLAGIMLVGPERSGRPYGFEDVEYLMTVGLQAAGVLVTARLSEAVMQAREFEAFHRLTSFMIHDLKNSISSLSLLSQNALQHGDDPEFQRDAVRTLSRTVARMKALLARMSGAPEATALQVQPVLWEDLAREAARPLEGSARVRCALDLKPTAPITGDPEALLRVVQNLVGNAVEALDGEGSVTVRTYADAGCSVLAVADTGCGMSEEFVRRSLFAPFKSTKKGGWGIGLYQARAIVEAHRGSIEVVSREGEGTTFSVRIPQADAMSWPDRKNAP